MPRNTTVPLDRKLLHCNVTTKKEPKPKLFDPDRFRWGRGLSHEGVGAKKLSMSLETREIKLFGGGKSPDSAGISRRCPKSLRRKSLCSILVQCNLHITLFFSEIAIFGGTLESATSGPERLPELKAIDYPQA